MSDASRRRSSSAERRRSGGLHRDGLLRALQHRRSFNKWKLPLVFYLLQSPRRNGELRRLIPAITQKMLTQQLRELEADGIIARDVFDQVPPKVVYDISVDERERLEQVLQPLCDWGLYWVERVGARVLALEP